MPRDDAGEDPPIEAKNAIDGLFARLSITARESFSPDQKAALVDAAETCAWHKHPVDIRLSIPLLMKRFYLVVVAGKERRHAGRRQAERVRFPVVTPKNFLFMFAFVALGTALGGACFTAATLWFLGS